MKSLRNLCKKKNYPLSHLVVSAQLNWSLNWFWSGVLCMYKQICSSYCQYAIPLHNSC